MRSRIPPIPTLILVVSFGATSTPALAHLSEPTARPLPSVTASAEPDAEIAATKRRPPPRKKPRRPAPRPDPRQPRGKRPDPAMVGLAASGGAATGAFIGASAVGLSTLVLFGVFGAPTLPVIITAVVVAITLGIAAPFMAAIGGGSAVLLMDPRTKPEEWSNLIQCAASGYCAGLSLVGGTLLGSVCGTAPGGARPPGIPGPDQAAEWTAGAAIAGLVGGTVMGALVGWSVAPTPEDPLVPITVGALGGAVLGSAVSAGVGAAVATAIKR